MNTQTVHQKASQTYDEQKQLEAQRNQARMLHEQKLQDLKDSQASETEKLSNHYEKERANLKKAYELQISEESKAHEQKLAELRKSQASEIAAVKQEKEKEFQNVTARERTRIENYRKKQEEHLAKLHAEYSGVEQNFKERAGKA